MAVTAGRTKNARSRKRKKAVRTAIQKRKEHRAEVRQTKRARRKRYRDHFRGTR